MTPDAYDEIILAAFVNTLKLSPEVLLMPKTRRLYPPEFHHQMVDLVRAERSPEDLAREFQPAAQ